MASGNDAGRRFPDTPWALLDDELKRWEEVGRTATLWWRDDDVSAPSPALDRLLALARRQRLPLVLAAIPARSETRLRRSLADEAGIVIAQHGFSHVDLSPAERKGRAELDTELADELMLERLAAGRRRMERLFGAQFEPLMVPPWNRIGGSLCRRLPEAGFRAVSTFGPRAAPYPASGLCQINTHCDIIDWKGGRVFRGTQRILNDLVEHLRGRRTGQVDGDEPSGILTHHLDHDDGCWTFLEQLMTHIGGHPAVRWPGREAFAP